ncbi:hypothetical protein [Stieleria magnilauensis]|uniref:Uncharacterized protein n=1 Tax=Stieleria magnilauensis TaxID=2527963 RepID=A0ABX5XWQ2_9BACT|nr:hypothetical protein TBK1r_47470 [Planctomycetes bacterium TBK1r]
MIERFDGTIASPASVRWRATCLRCVAAVVIPSRLVAADVRVSVANSVS